MRVCDLCGSKEGVKTVGFSVREVLSRDGGGQLVKLVSPQEDRDTTMLSEYHRHELAGDICKECLAEISTGFADLGSLFRWIRSKGQ